MGILQIWHSYIQQNFELANDCRTNNVVLVPKNSLMIVVASVWIIDFYNVLHCPPLLDLQQDLVWSLVQYCFS